MNIRDRKSIHNAAQVSLAGSADALKSIVLTYVLITTGLAVISAGLSAVLSDRIADTSGLGGMGLRSILSTMQTVLPLVQTLVLMGLQIGYCSVAMGVCRGEAVSRNTLLGGFRYFMPMLRTAILQGFLYFSMGLLCMYLSVYLFLFLPISEDFRNLIMPLVQDASILSGTIMLDEATVLAATETMTPLLWIFGALFLGLFLPTYYNYRMTLYRLIDLKQPRALQALHESRTLMRGNRKALLKLDLSLWWFYALQVLIVLVCYGDLILQLLGIALPFSDTALYYVFLALSLALQAAVYYFTMNRVAITYGHAYEALLAEHHEKEKNAPKRPPLRIILNPRRFTNPENDSENP